MQNTYSHFSHPEIWEPVHSEENLKCCLKNDPLRQIQVLWTNQNYYTNFDNLMEGEVDNIW
jgi:hypothetical protein